MSWLLEGFRSARHSSTPPSENERNLTDDSAAVKTETHGSQQTTAPTTNLPFFPYTNPSADALDLKALHPLAGLDQPLNYLVLEDQQFNNMPGEQSVLPSRGWTDDLCYTTGSMYLGAQALGGAYGITEGIRQTQLAASRKLKLNAVLNAVTRRGPFLGNSAGMLAILYSGTASTIDYYRGKSETVNSVAAGAIAGSLFKCTKGVKAMAVASALTASAAALWCQVRAKLRP